MICKNINKNVPACYLLPNMTEVRANFLLNTKQYERLKGLRTRLNKFNLDLEMCYDSRKLEIRTF